MRSAIEPLRAAGRLPDPLSVWLTDSLHLLAATPNAIIESIGHPSVGKPDPILYFYEHFLAAYDRVERIMNQDANRESLLAEIVSEVSQSPAIDASLKEAQQYTLKAKSLLDELPPNDIKPLLRELADFVVQRKA